MWKSEQISSSSQLHSTQANKKNNQVAEGGPCLSKMNSRLDARLDLLWLRVSLVQLFVKVYIEKVEFLKSA